MSSQSKRQYDLILLGATGYTGRLTAEYISTAFETNFSWAIAGRSHEKLQTLLTDLKQLNPDRRDPGVEISGLDDTSLTVLAKKTKLLLNCVGPYSLYGEPVVKACAENGTHYLDVTGETPWVAEMVKNYHGKAQLNKSIVIPQIGIESAPSDLLAYTVASNLHKQGLSTKSLVLAVRALKVTVSGGTMSSLLTVFAKYSIPQLLKASKPGVVCPRPLAKQTGLSLLNVLTGVRVVSGLGVLARSLPGQIDATIVNRSWALLAESSASSCSLDYGPNFRFYPYMSVRNVFIGLLVYFGSHILVLLLLLPPVRWIISRCSLQPGAGASKEVSSRDRLEYRAIAFPDTTDRKETAFGRLVWEGSGYEFTGLLLAEGARTILANEECVAKELGGGILTPATLGVPFIERLVNGGMVLESSIHCN